MLLRFRFNLNRACGTENLDSRVLVMQSTENSMRPDATDPLNRSREWRVFVQRPVRSQIVVIAGISLQNPAEVYLAQGDHMVEALASDRSNQSFGEAVLPGRTCCQCGRSSRSLPIAAIYSHASKIVRSVPPSFVGMGEVSFFERYAGRNMA